MKVAGVLPSYASPDVTYLAGGNAKVFGNVYGTVSGGSSFSDLSGDFDSEYCVFSTRAQSGKPVMLIFFFGAPLKIFNRVVGLISVLVINKRKIVRIGDKRDSDKAVDEPVKPFWLSPQKNASVKRLIAPFVSAASASSYVSLWTFYKSFRANHPSGEPLDFFPNHFPSPLCSLKAH